METNLCIINLQKKIINTGWLFMTKSFLQLKELLYFCRSMAGVLRLWCLPLECHVDFGFGTFHAATLGTSILDKTTEMS